MILAFAAGMSIAAEQKIAKKDVPAAVVSGVARDYPNTPLKTWEKDMRDGAPIYEVGIPKAGAIETLVYSAEGKLIETEDDFPVKNLPAPVVDAVHKKYPRATIRSADKVTRGSEIRYEVGLKGADKKEVVVSSAGEIQ
ncbi:MAG: PepSY-like domain-containing protein [Acidobacteriota bacterium]|nr:PepSY-like domain-containing protein [Acidobacteriota bacterium]